MGTRCCELSAPLIAIAGRRAANLTDHVQWAMGNIQYTYTRPRGAALQNYIQLSLPVPESSMRGHGTSLESARNSCMSDLIGQFIVMRAPNVPEGLEKPSWSSLNKKSRSALVVQ